MPSGLASVWRLQVRRRQARDLRAVDSTDAPAARTIGNPVSLDTNLQVFGAGNLTFTGDATLTGSRNISVFDPSATAKLLATLAKP